MEPPCCIPRQERGKSESMISLPRPALLLLVAAFCSSQGCSLTKTSNGAANLAKGAVHGILHPTSLLPHSKPTPPPPPKAGILREAGTIRSVSEDGGYVIVELAPGTSLTPGATLIAAGTDGGTVRLKTGEISYPCCVADIEEGHPSPGDIVKR